MTTVLIPTLCDGAGAVLPAVVSVALVDADGTPVIGFAPQTLLTEGRTLDLNAVLAVELMPQALLGLPAGAASWYVITIKGKYREASYRVQVPDQTTPIELRALVGAAAIDSASVLAGRLLPDPAAVGDGWALSVANAQPVWVPAAPGSGDMQALLYDPRGVRADAFSTSNLTGAIDGGTF